MNQNQQIRAYLKSGGVLTGLKALRIFGTMRLAARIHDLRSLGMRIKATKKKIRGKWVCEYRRG